LLQVTIAHRERRSARPPPKGTLVTVLEMTLLLALGGLLAGLIGA
jgi:hypothetical protein